MLMMFVSMGDMYCTHITGGVIVLLVLVGRLVVSDGFIVHLLLEVDLCSVAERVHVVRVTLQHFTTPPPGLCKVV